MGLIRKIEDRLKELNLRGNGCAWTLRERSHPELPNKWWELTFIGDEKALAMALSIPNLDTSEPPSPLPSEKDGSSKPLISHFPESPRPETYAWKCRKCGASWDSPTRPIHDCSSLLQLVQQGVLEPFWISPGTE